MIIKLTLTKELQDDFNYIYDRSPHTQMTKVIRDLIRDHAIHLRLKYGDVRGYTHFIKALCHPEKKHYAKGYCRKCYKHGGIAY